MNIVIENNRQSFAAIAAYADAFSALVVAGQAVAATRSSGAAPAFEVLEAVRESVLGALEAEATASVSYVGPVFFGDDSRTERQVQGEVESYVAEAMCAQGVADAELRHYYAALNARASLRAVLDAAMVVPAAELSWHECDAFGVHSAQVRLPGRMVIAARVCPDRHDEAAVTLRAYCPERGRFVSLMQGEWHALADMDGLEGDGEALAAEVTARLSARQAADRDAAACRVLAGAW